MLVYLDHPFNIFSPQFFLSTCSHLQWTKLCGCGICL